MATESLSRIKKLQAHALALWEEKWTDSEHETRPSLVQRFIRFWIFVGRSFSRNRCPVRASSLAYTTLLALVPVLAVVISISTSVLKTKTPAEIGAMINTAVFKIAPQLELQEDLKKQIADVISASANTFSGGTIKATAAIALMFIAISLLSSIEATLNDIWGVLRGRSWFTRIIYYWAVLTLGPILLLSAMGLAAGPAFGLTVDWLESVPQMKSLLTLLILIFAFSAFYFLMPNTKVEFGAALVGGIVGGGLFHLNSKSSALYFDQVVRNSKLWGGLGSVPVFLVGLYFSWMILLFGAQVAYAFQNRHSYFQEKQADNINQRGREFVALRIMTLIAEHFQKGLRPPSICQLADALSVPSRLVSRIIQPLLQTKLVVEIGGSKSADLAYSPGRPLHSISYQNILDALRAGMGQEVATKEDAMRGEVRRELERVQQAERAVASEITLEHLVQAAASQQDRRVG